MRTIAFDVETIPDLEYGKKNMNLDGLSDEDIGRSMFFQQLQKKGDEFLPIDLHKIITISCIAEENGIIELKSFTQLEHFINFIKDADQFVTWNGHRFDVPVIAFRTLIEHLVINNKLLDDKHHTDLKAVLSNGNISLISGLDRVSKHLGLPGKTLHSGTVVWDLYVDNKIQEIIQYCEADVLNTYLIYIHHQYTIAEISNDQLREKKETLKSFLSSSEHHHNEFIEKL
ncbi:MAG: ribonuclease H-like domain-containing protein [Gammaproteobacteria bacterium]|jgi:predicted PolB exonuclease-like 3'-5' exonuclease